MSQQINHPTISETEIIRPTRVEVDLNAITENYQKIKEHVGSCKIMPILKANAYGHGLLRIAFKSTSTLVGRIISVSLIIG